MLSVQSVNLMNQNAFQSRTNSKRVDEGYDYSRKDYEADRTRLEEHLDEINEVIENTDVPKPVRAFGKVVSVGIGAGLGFVSMKFGSQGVVKFAKSGLKYVNKFMQKPFVHSTIEKAGKLKASASGAVKSAYNKIAGWSSNTKCAKKLNEFYAGITNNKFSKKAADLSDKFLNLKPVKYVNGKVADAYKSVKSITGKQVETGFVNLMAVSGGVTGGVTALQEVTKE